MKISPLYRAKRKVPTCYVGIARSQIAVGREGMGVSIYETKQTSDQEDVHKD
jgi:hypothetical protein